MADFVFWILNGFWHIIDFSGYDHMLFILALTGLYGLNEWKKLVILITSFTIGHSITLLLSVFEVIQISPDLVEILIPATIIATCYQNIFPVAERPKDHFSLNYFLALGFGFIHGMGFSIQLKMLLGRQEQIAFELLSFNLGIEAAQLLIVIAILLFKWLITKKAGINTKNLNTIISIAVFALAFVMLAQRLYFFFNSNE